MTYTDPCYQWYKSEAHRVGAVFGAYHWLDSSSDAEVQHVFNVVGHTPLMIDWEGTTKLTDIGNFVNKYRKLGGVVHLAYVPKWRWLQYGGGTPSFLTRLHVGLVSSNYKTYSDLGDGWCRLMVDVRRSNGSTVIT